ncbi:MAG: hotdog domain-containing protein [Pirellulaceae bacterium]
MTQSDESAAAEEPYLALKALMMPRDTNPHGTIFGGVLLSYIDQAGAIGALHMIRGWGWPPRLLVTVGMNAVEFHEPVFIGDIVSFTTTVARIGATSITMHVAVETERNDETIRLTEADVTYVSVSSAQGPREKVPLRP